MRIVVGLSLSLGILASLVFSITTLQSVLTYTPDASNTAAQRLGPARMQALNTSSGVTILSSLVPQQLIMAIGLVLTAGLWVRDMVGLTSWREKALLTTPAVVLGYFAFYPLAIANALVLIALTSAQLFAFNLAS